MYFTNSYQALDELKKHLNEDSDDQLTREQYEEAVEIIIRDASKMEAFVRYGYCTKNEFNKIKRVAFLKSPKTLAYMLKVIPYNNWLTNEEKEKAVEICLIDPDACLYLLENYNGLTISQRKEAIKTIMMGDIYTLKSVISSGKLTDNELQYIVNEFRDDKQRSNLKDMFISLGHHDKINSGRRLAFSILAKDKDYIINLAENKRLSNEEKIIIHDLYEDEIYSEKRTMYRGYVKYCQLFKHCLSYREQKLLAKKIIKRGDKREIRQLKNDIEFEQEFIDQIDSFLLVDKLANSAS